MTRAAVSNLFYIRHGQSKANVDKVFAGSRVDASLTDLGSSQAEQAGIDIKEKNIVFDHVFISPLIRAQETATIVLEAIGHEGTLVTDERLTEYDMGLRSGTSNVEPVSGVELTSGEEAEDPEEFRERVRQFMDYAKSHQGNVLIVGHSFVYRMIEIINNHGDPRLFSELPAPKNGTLLSLEYSS